MPDCTLQRTGCSRCSQPVAERSVKRLGRHKVTVSLLKPGSPAEWRGARRLVEEYASSLNLDLSFQNFAQEPEHFEMRAEYSGTRDVFWTHYRPCFRHGRFITRRGSGLSRLTATIRFQEQRFLNCNCTSKNPAEIWLRSGRVAIEFASKLAPTRYRYAGRRLNCGKRRASASRSAATAAPSGREPTPALARNSCSA